MVDSCSPPGRRRALGEIGPVMKAARCKWRLNYLGQSVGGQRARARVQGGLPSGPLARGLSGGLLSRRREHLALNWPFVS